MSAEAGESKGRWERRAGKVLLLGVLAGLVVLAAWVIAWRASGGRWYIVKSPSMGTTAPVGTLVWVRPVHFDDVHVGDVITFHPPSASGTTYTHRVVAKRTDGTLTTKGDNNDVADPWSVGRNDLIGRAAMFWWPVGWILKATPIFGIGIVVLWGLTRWFTAPSWKLPAWIVGLSLLVSLSLYVVKPLVRAEMVSFVPAERGAQATFVTTGILPLRISAQGGGHVDAAPGEKRSLVATHRDHYGLYRVRLAPHLSWRWWLVVALIVVAPALYTLLVGLPPVEEKGQPGEGEGGND